MLPLRVQILHLINQNFNANVGGICWVCPQICVCFTLIIIMDLDLLIQCPYGLLFQWIGLIDRADLSLLVTIYPKYALYDNRFPPAYGQVLGAFILPPYGQHPSTSPSKRRFVILGHWMEGAGVIVETL